MIMPKLSATFRIVLSLASLSTSLVLLAAVVGLLPDGRPAIAEGRQRLCESLAINFSTMARSTDIDTVKKCFDMVVRRNPDIQSLGVRRVGGELLVELGDHNSAWTLNDDEKSTETQMVVPVYANHKPWGALEVRFQPTGSSGLTSWALGPEFGLACFMAISTFAAFYFYLRKALRHLNPSKVIPGRVREAFDSLSEGLVVLDSNEHIVLANRAFALVAGRTPEQLLGQLASSLPFVSREETPFEVYPWQETISNATPVRGRLLGLKDHAGRQKVFSVSSAPILDEQGRNRGALASFEDVSRLEKKKQELLDLVEHLHASSEQIKRQNQELEFLATRDALTGCLNRRAFLEQVELLWYSAHRYGHPLSLVMVDVDHFKLINDQHGHTFGDEVLQKVAAKLIESARDSDAVCRFGGEEFVILLPNTPLNQADVAAEKFRVEIESLFPGNVPVTASFGVSAISERPKTPQELLDQADKCLYIAKRSGRNQVVRWDAVPLELDGDESQMVHSAPDEVRLESSTIPYHAVTALISALAYRDQETAAHSRRVADLCVATAEGLLSLQDSYLLEIAALLHDIGKIGVPDSILLKPGPLTESEWDVMHTQDGIGAEIIRASFQSQIVSEIVESHRRTFGGDATQIRSRPRGTMSVGARILAIADAYDAMVSRRVYRPGRTRDDAIAELRRCAGTQFDPELVERFVRMLQIRGPQQALQECSQVSTEAALSIGLQIERLMAVLDQHDFKTLRILSHRLNSTAVKYGATSIAAKAAELETYFQDESDAIGLIQAANELLDLCRSTQSAFLVRVPCDSALNEAVAR